MNKMINEKLIQILKTNEKVLELKQKINSYIQSERKTLQIIDAIYVKYVSTCVKSRFEINEFIKRLNKYLKQLEAKEKNHKKLKIDNINYFEYISYRDGEITYQVKYQEDKKGFVYLEYNNTIYPVRLLKWKRFKEQTMRYIQEFNPNNMQNHSIGLTYKIILKAPRISVTYNYTRKKYKNSYWDLDYNIKRHTAQNIIQFDKKEKNENE